MEDKQVKMVKPLNVFSSERGLVNAGEEAPHITSPQNPGPTVAGSGDSPSGSERPHAEKGTEAGLGSERGHTRIPPQGRQFHFIRKPKTTDENMG